MLHSLFSSGKPGEPGNPSTQRACSPGELPVPGTPKTMLKNPSLTDVLSGGDDRASRHFIEFDVFPERHEKFSCQCDNANASRPFAATAETLRMGDRMGDRQAILISTRGRSL